MHETCNICGGTSFEDFAKRLNIRCTQCQSLERTRVLGLYLDQLDLPPGAKVLHVAPEKGLWQRFSARSDIAEYTVADYNPELYNFVECRKIDLCNLEDWPSDLYDLIIHVHVLEHTYCNIAYSLFHLHRMLSASGRHLFIVPFTRGRYDESFQPMDTEERTRRYGQWDHVRRIGVEDIGAHLGKVVRVPEAFATPDTLRQANVPEAMWTGFHGSTILDMGKRDYLLA